MGRRKPAFREVGRMRKGFGGEKKLLLASLAVFAMVLLCGCRRQAAEEAVTEDKLKIVCTIFPEYDWVKQILGERTDSADLTLLLVNGADLHSYQPTIWDMKEIAEADLFLYVGGESDFWVEKALENGENPDRKVLNLMEILKDSVVEEEHLEGMQEVRGHIHEADEEEYDEHVWLSLRNAGKVCQAVTEALCTLDEAHSSLYQKNNETYQAQLQELDLKYIRTVGQTEKPVLLFGDRFPFCYLAKDYGITCYAAFAGCSAETEASFSTVAFLAGKAGELRLPTVLAIDGSDQKIARTIAENTRSRDQQVRILDSMQSVSKADLERGENYLSIMERNLEVLAEALAAREGE